MVSCSQCRKNLPAHLRYCPYCGARQGVVVQPTRPRRGGQGVVLWSVALLAGVALLLAAGGVGFALMLLLNRSNPTAPPVVVAPPSTTPVLPTRTMPPPSPPSTPTERPAAPTPTSPPPPTDTPVSRPSRPPTLTSAPPTLTPEAVWSSDSLDRGCIGITNLTINPTLQPTRQTFIDRGLLIDRLFGEPAVKAGLRLGDIIVSANGTQVDTFDDLDAVLSQAKVGETVRLGFFRGKRLFVTTVEVGRRSLPLNCDAPDAPPIAPEPASLPWDSATLGQTCMGVGTRDVIQDDIGKTGLPVDYGRVVTGLSGAPSIMAGLRIGDIITQMDGQPVRTADELGAVLRRVGVGGTVRLTVYRKSETLNLTMRVGRRVSPDICDLP